MVQERLVRDDAAVAALLFGDEQGTLMYLVGSDYEGLQEGNDALTRIWEEYPEHPLANVARVIQGVNAAREFKEIQPDNSVRVRDANAETAAELLAPVLDVAAVRKSVAKQKDAAQRTATVARQLRTEIAPAQSDAALEGYLVARRREIAAEVGGDLG